MKKKGKTKGPPDRIGPWLAQKAMVNQMADQSGISPDQITIFDCGCSVGEVTELYLRMFPHASMHCFDPEPDSIISMLARFEDNPQVAMNQVALADTEQGSVPFFVGGMSGEMSSLFPRPSGDIRRYYRHKLDTEIHVSTTTLDKYCKQAGVEIIHTLKVDVQGGEGDLLRGARRMLREHRVWMLYMEVFFVQMYEASAPFWQLCSFLSRYEYSLFDLYMPGRSRVNRQLKYADALWVSPEIRHEVLDTFPEEWLARSASSALGVKWG